MGIEDNINSRGAPSYFDRVEDLQSKIDQYFESLSEEQSYPTVSGLALFLGYASRQSVYDLQKNKKFSYTIKRAILRIENFHEAGLYGKNVTGHIFWLKNRGWTDSQTMTIKKESKTEEELEEELRDIERRLGECE